MRLGWRRSALLFTALFLATLRPPDISAQSAAAVTFVNYFAPEDCPVTVPPSPPSSNCITPAPGSTTAAGHDAGEPSIGVNWTTGNAFIEAGNHTLRVTFDDSVTPA